MNRQALALEAATLRTVIDIYGDRIDAAIEAREEIAQRVMDTFGFHPSELPGQFPAYDAAAAVVRELRDSDGYYWTNARYVDIDLLIGGKQQLLATGDWAWVYCGAMPKANPSVAPFVAAVLAGKFSWPVAA